MDLQSLPFLLQHCRSMNIWRNIEAEGLFCYAWKMTLVYDFLINVTKFLFSPSQITLPYDAQQLSKATRDTAALYLACGVDPSKVQGRYWSFLILFRRLYVFWIFYYDFVCAGICFCAVSCSCSCRTDVALKFCSTCWLA